MPMMTSSYGLFAGYRGMPMFAPADGGGSGSGEGGEGEGGEGNPAKGAGGNPASGSGDGGAKTPTKTDAEKKLERELAGANRRAEETAKQAEELAAKLKTFEGIDPSAVRELLAAQKQAQDDAKRAEEERLKAAGDFEALKKRMAEEHTREIGNVEKQVKALDAEKAALTAQIHELTIGQAFSASNYLRQETLLTPTKARRVYEDHFEIQDGAVVGFDKPRGAHNRTPLVDARGKPLPFDEAIKAIVEDDPDRDALLKSKMRAGSGQQPSGGGSSGNRQPNSGDGDGDDAKLTPTERIARALQARRDKRS